MDMKEFKKAWNKYIIIMQEAREQRFEKRLRRAKRFKEMNLYESRFKK